MNPLLWFIVLPVAAGIVAVILHIYDRCQESKQQRLREDYEALTFGLAQFDALVHPKLGVITESSLDATLMITASRDFRRNIKHLKANLSRFGHEIDRKDDVFYQVTPGGVAKIPLVELTWGASRQDLLAAQAASPLYHPQG